MVGDDDTMESNPFDPRISLLSLRSMYAVNPMQPREWFGINRYARFMHRDLPVNISYGSGRHHMEFNGDVITGASAASIQQALNLSTPFIIEVVRDGSFIAKYKWSPWPENIGKMLVINRKYTERNLNENDNLPPGLRVMTHQFSTAEELIAERNDVLRTHYLFDLQRVPLLFYDLSTDTSENQTDGRCCSYAAGVDTCSITGSDGLAARRCRDYFLYSLRAAHHRTWLEFTNGVPKYLIDGRIPQYDDADASSCTRYDRCKIGGFNGEQHKHILADRFLQPIRLIDHTGNYTTKYLNVSFCDLLGQTVSISASASMEATEGNKKSRLQEDIESFCIYEAAYPDLGQCTRGVDKFLRAFILDPNQQIV
jgi:hypothetical protein